MNSDTVFALLTPPGRTALMTLGLQGPRAWEWARTLFRPVGARTALPEQALPGAFWFGHLHDQQATAGPEVVLAVRPAKDWPALELHAPGGQAVYEFLQDLLLAQGGQLITWMDYLGRLYADPIQTAAQVALARAPTLRVASILMDQYAGALRRALEHIELLFAQGQTQSARTETEVLLNRWHLVGQHLTQPWQVVIAGAPNAGKSSLVNALAGYQRCVVAPTPGTTRDVVSTRLAFGGWPVDLADTAGLRMTGEDLEAQGIARAVEAARQADLCLWVVDASSEPVWPDSLGVHFEADTGVRELHKVRFVLNKVDLPAAWDLNRTLTHKAVRTSTVTGEGIAELTELLGQWIVPEPLEPGLAIPFAPEHAEMLRATLRQ